MFYYTVLLVISLYKHDLYIYVRVCNILKIYVSNVET